MLSAQQCAEAERMAPGPTKVRFDRFPVFSTYVLLPLHRAEEDAKGDKVKEKPQRWAAGSSASLQPEPKRESDQGENGELMEGVNNPSEEGEAANNQTQKAKDAKDAKFTCAFLKTMYFWGIHSLKF